MSHKIATFNRFDVVLPSLAVPDCSHAGACDDDVAYWAPLTQRTTQCTPEALEAELREYGAWDDNELADDEANWRRIVWLAASQIREEEYEASKRRSA